MNRDLYWIAVAVVTVVSAARITRLLTWDKFPPISYLRDKYADWTDATDRRRPWQLLAFCGYCMSFWVTTGIVVWGYLSGVYTEPSRHHDEPAFLIWWLANGVLAASYAAAICMTHDGDEGDES